MLLYMAGNPGVFDQMLQHEGYANAMGRVRRTLPCHISSGNSDFVWLDREDAEMEALTRGESLGRELKVYGVLASWFTDVQETDVPGKGILLFNSLVVALKPY